MGSVFCKRVSQKIDTYTERRIRTMEWYGKEHLNPTYTKKLMKKWQAPPGNTAENYYALFPELYPKHLPPDHYIVKYNEENFPKDREYKKD